MDRRAILGRVTTLEDAERGEVFISYSHDSDEHRERVRDLAAQLRRDGVQSEIDLYEPSPDQGWPRWMQSHVLSARRILVVCTETYQRRFEGREVEGKGRGVTWEGHLLTQTLYEANERNARIRPVVFGDDVGVVPLALRSYRIYRLPSEYEAVFRWLTDQDEAPPPVGRLRIMPPRGG